MRRLRRRVKKKILLVIGCIIVQIGLFFVCKVMMNEFTVREYEERLQEKDAILQAAGRTVYITRQEIKAGELFTEENTEKRYLLSEQNPDALATDVMGMTACADLLPGVILTNALCYKGECEPSERECVYYNLGAVEYFSSYAVVDVRLRYANGENYCVLQKKRLQKGNEDKKTCYFYLTEEEQLLMSAAQYDVTVYDGAELYLVGFKEERLQDTTVSKYLPPVQVVSQLREWKEEYHNFYGEWCDSREALEQRLLEYIRRRRDGLA